MERLFRGHKIIINAAKADGIDVFECSIKPINIHADLDRLVYSDYIDRISQNFIEALNVAKERIGRT